MSGSGRRILHVWLPFLATDRLAVERSRALSPERTPAERAVAQRTAPAPWVTVAKVRGAIVIAATDRTAQAAGLVAGAPLAQARAMVPDVRVEIDDPDADGRTLLSLARAADRYTPLVALDRPHGLFLDITGCAHLFGGEEGLRADLSARLLRWGFEARTAVADTPAAAWAVARYGADGVVPTGGDEAAVARLPAESLRLPAETVAVLARLGLKTVAQVRGQPRAPLMQRFGPLIARRLDQLAGAEHEPIDPLSPVAPFVVERAFAEPLAHMGAIEAGLDRLAERLCTMLHARGEGARRLRLRLFHADGAVREIVVGASEPLDEPGRMAKLVRPRLDALSARIETESGIDLMRLHAEETARPAVIQARLDASAVSMVDLAQLVDTLSERLGIAAVQRFARADTHQPAAADLRLSARDNLRHRSWPPLPERAPGGTQSLERVPDGTQSLERVPDGTPLHHHPPSRPPFRPLRLFTPPEPVVTMASVPDGPPVRFVWRRAFYHVAAAEGPERIAPEWWREDASMTRDYFRVEDVDGRRFWMFRRGLYASETMRPEWFLHGLFA